MYWSLLGPRYYMVYNELCDIWYTPFLRHMLMYQAVLLRGGRALRWIWFFEKKNLKFFILSGSGQSTILAKRAEPVNQAELVPGPEPDKIKNFKIFFPKIKSTSMPDHHVKGQPAASMYVQIKGCVTFHSNRDSPCIYRVITHYSLVITLLFYSIFPAC